MMKPFAPVDPATLQVRLEMVFDRILPLMEEAQGENRAIYYGQLLGLLAGLFQAGIIGPDDFELRRLAVHANYAPGSLETFNPFKPDA